MPVVRTDWRTYGHVITKLSGMGRLPHFLRYGATLAHGHCITNLKIADSFFKKMGIIVAIKSQHYLSTFCPTAKLHLPGVFLKTGLNK